MNKTTGITIVSIAALLIVGGIIYYANTGSVTPIVVDNNTNTTQTSQPGTNVAGVPVTVTQSGAIPTDTTAVLTGQVTPNGALTNYWYEYGLTANLGSKSTTQMLGSGFM